MRFNKKLKTLLFVSTFFGISLFAEDITIAVHDYAPYYNGDGKGLMIEVYQEIYNQSGVNVNFEVLPIKRALSHLFENRVDAFSPGDIFMTPQMKENAVWDTSFVVVLSLFHYKPNFDKQITYNSIDDLKGYKLAVLTNTSLIPMYKEHGIEYYEVDSPKQMIEMVKEGRVDFCVITLITGMSLISQDFFEYRKDFDYFVLQLLPCSLSFSTGNPDYIKRYEQFKTGLDIIKANGRYLEILENYWGKGNVPKDVLFPDMLSVGVEHANIETFGKYSRNKWGKILGNTPK